MDYRERVYYLVQTKPGSYNDMILRLKEYPKVKIHPPYNHILSGDISKLDRPLKYKYDGLDWLITDVKQPECMVSCNWMYKDNIESVLNIFGKEYGILDKFNCGQ